MIAILRKLICHHLHGLQWPLNGTQRCHVCHREYPVSFERQQINAAYVEAASRRAR